MEPKIEDWEAERNYMENLLNQRFNFFLVFYSLVIVGCISAEIRQHQLIVLIAGSVICFLLWLTIARAYERLFYMVQEKIYSDDARPAKITRDALSKNLRGYRKVIGGGSRVWLIGYGIPGFCTATLIAGAILSAIGILEIAATLPEKGT